MLHIFEVLILIAFHIQIMCSKMLKHKLFNNEIIIILFTLVRLIYTYIYIYIEHTHIYIYIIFQYTPTKKYYIINVSIKCS